MSRGSNSASFPNENALISAKGKSLQCYECKEFGHVSRNCKKKAFCNYCKRIGHIIFECTRRPQKRNGDFHRRLNPNQNSTALQAQAHVSQAHDSHSVLCIA